MGGVSGTGGSGGSGGAGGSGGDCAVNPATIDCPASYDAAVARGCLGWTCTARCGSAFFSECHGGAYARACVYDQDKRLIAGRFCDDSVGGSAFCTRCPQSCSSGCRSIGAFPDVGQCVFDEPDAAVICP
jgi:hypothetical protein